MDTVAMNLPDLKQLAVHFMKFGVVGGVGTVINLSIFYVLVDVLKLEENTGSVIAFCVAVTGNYYLNENWTFRVEGKKTGFNRRAFIKYIAINVFGLAINLVVLNAIIDVFHPSLKLYAQAGGIAAAMIFNFITSKLFVFK